MRQLTPRYKICSNGAISKLPMRQLTFQHYSYICSCISKLPMRQLTPFSLH